MGRVGKMSLEEFRRKRKEILSDMRGVFYYHIHRFGNNPRWRGQRLVKLPTDVVMYAEEIFKSRPDYIVETGTRFGGSALFFADMLVLTKSMGHVITIDIEKNWKVKHPKIEYIKGSSIDPAIVSMVKEKVADKTVMVSLDSNHRARFVTKEMNAYAPIATVGQCMVVEDAYTDSDREYWPKKAINEFVKTNKDYVLEHPEDKYLMGMTRGGWLRRMR